jgi:hypothetical protein
MDKAKVERLEAATCGNIVVCATASMAMITMEAMVPLACVLYNFACKPEHTVKGTSSSSSLIGAVS